MQTGAKSQVCLNSFALKCTCKRLSPDAGIIDEMVQSISGLLSQHTTYKPKLVLLCFASYVNDTLMSNCLPNGCLCSNTDRNMAEPTWQWGFQSPLQEEQLHASLNQSRENYQDLWIWWALSQVRVSFSQRAHLNQSIFSKQVAKRIWHAIFFRAEGVFTVSSHSLCESCFSRLWRPGVWLKRTALALAQQFDSGRLKNDM